MMSARKSRGRALAAALTAAVLVGGCTGFVDQRGNKIEERRLEAIEPGQTSKAELAQIWGTPSAKSTFDDNTWYYISKRTERVAFLEPETTDQRVLVVRFDENEKIASISEKGLADAREVAMVGRKTPTIGEEPTLFGSLYNTLLQGPVGALGGGTTTNDGFNPK